MANFTHFLQNYNLRLTRASILPILLLFLGKNKPRGGSFLIFFFKGNCIYLNQNSVSPYVTNLKSLYRNRRAGFLSRNLKFHLSSDEFELYSRQKFTSQLSKCHQTGTHSATLWIKTHYFIVEIAIKRLVSDPRGGTSGLENEPLAALLSSRRVYLLVWSMSGIKGTLPS